MSVMSVGPLQFEESESMTLDQRVAQRRQQRADSPPPGAAKPLVIPTEAEVQAWG